MSSPKRQVVVSPRARTDFVDILRYTGQTWGQAQLLAYRDKLNNALELLGKHADLGHASPELPPTHRVYFVGEHVIVYQVNTTNVSIVRILHQRMSPTRHL